VPSNFNGLRQRLHREKTGNNREMSALLTTFNRSQVHDLVSIFVPHLYPSLNTVTFKPGRTRAYLPLLISSFVLAQQIETLLYFPFPSSVPKFFRLIYLPAPHLPTLHFTFAFTPFLCFSSILPTPLRQTPSLTQRNSFSTVIFNV
jgi:hypothetical protein